MPAYRIAENSAAAVRILVDGVEVEAMPGDTVAAAMVASLGWVVRTTQHGDSRGPFCLIGACQECLVEIDGVPNRRSCMHAVSDGMRVRRQ